MGSIHLVDPMIAWSEWTAPADRLMGNGMSYREKRERDAYVLQQNRRCAACGKYIKKGIRVYKILVSWGPKATQSDFRPMHTGQCIPMFRFELQDADGRLHVFQTNEFSHNPFDVERVGEPSSRTLIEATEWVRWAKRCYEEDRFPTIAIVGYKVFQDGREVVAWREEGSEILVQGSL